MEEMGSCCQCLQLSISSVSGCSQAEVDWDGNGRVTIGMISLYARMAFCEALVISACNWRDTAAIARLFNRTLVACVGKYQA